MPSFPSLFRKASPLDPPKEPFSLFSRAKGSTAGKLTSASLVTANPSAAVSGVALAPVAAVAGSAGALAAPPSASVAGIAPPPVAAGSGVSSAPAPVGADVASSKTDSSWRSYLPSLARQTPAEAAKAAEAAAQKTRTGLFKSVVEGVNWVRANNKNIIKDAQAGKEKWGKPPEGINTLRSDNKLPATYSNMEFNDYDLDEYRNLKKKNGTWLPKPEQLTPK